jgi:hypothetical protein
MASSRVISKVIQIEDGVPVIVKTIEERLTLEELTKQLEDCSNKKYWEIDQLSATNHRVENLTAEISEIESLLALFPQEEEAPVEETPVDEQSTGE